MRKPSKMSRIVTNVIIIIVVMGLAISMAKDGFHNLKLAVNSGVRSDMVWFWYSLKGMSLEFGAIIFCMLASDLVQRCIRIAKGKL
jgi:hypothetical protein